MTIIILLFPQHYYLPIFIVSSTTQLYPIHALEWWTVDTVTFVRWLALVVHPSSTWKCNHKRPPPKLLRCQHLQTQRPRPNPNKHTNSGGREAHALNLDSTVPLLVGPIQCTLCLPMSTDSDNVIRGTNGRYTRRRWCWTPKAKHTRQSLVVHGLGLALEWAKQQTHIVLVCSKTVDRSQHRTLQLTFHGPTTTTPSTEMGGYIIIAKTGNTDSGLSKTFQAATIQW